MVDVKHFENCKQLLISIGCCYLIEALPHFFGMDSVDGTPERNIPFLSGDAGCEEKKTCIEEAIGTFIDYILESLSVNDQDEDSVR